MKESQKPIYNNGKNEGATLTEAEAAGVKSYQQSPSVYRGLLKYLGAKPDSNEKS